MDDNVFPLHSFDRYLGQSKYHHIDVTFGGVQLIHEEPFVFLLHNFLSPAECQELVGLLQTAKQQPSATAQGQEGRRTSTSMYPLPTQIKWLRDRIAAATNVPHTHLEPTKMTSYAKGEFFQKHTDASFLNEKMWAFAAKLAEVDDEGVQDPCRWPSRFCTLFLYLNDVNEGGRTCFRWLDGSGGIPGGNIFEQCIQALPGKTPDEPHAHIMGSYSSANRSSPSASGVDPREEALLTELHIKPRVGMAVVHFPATTLACNCIPDPVHILLCNTHTHTRTRTHIIKDLDDTAQ